MSYYGVRTLGRSQTVLQILCYLIVVNDLPSGLLHCVEEFIHFFILNIKSNETFSI